MKLTFAKEDRSKHFLSKKVSRLFERSVVGIMVCSEWQFGHVVSSRSKGNRSFGNGEYGMGKSIRT